MADNVPVGIQYITLLTCFWIATFNRPVPMADSKNSDSPQAKLLRECARGFETRALDLIAKPLHKDFRYVPYPKSLGKPEQTKEEWLERYAGIIGLWPTDPEVGYIRYSSVPFAATESLPQTTTRFIIDTPGKIVTHVRFSNARIHRIYLCNVVPTSQVITKVKTSIGVERIRESIFIAHIVTDEDGSLKIIRGEDFTDSKAELDFIQALTARAEKQ